MTPVNWFQLACFLGFTGVLAGAFGAHALKGTVTVDRLEAFQTGVQYQLVHAPALILASLSCDEWSVCARWFLAIGVFLFSGSLYFLVLLDLPQLGAITPLGGICMLIGWATLGLSAKGR